MIEAIGLSKRYGERLAVDDLTFTVQPGVVTGFLGPNGAGKSTTMRMILGLDAPSSGTVTVNGKAYNQLAAPLHEIGAMLEARAIHTGRSAYNHLLAMTQTHGIPRRRIDEVIDMVGLQSVARKRAGGFSLGMGQRLGIAAALLGDPPVLMFDEPVNGLDPEGVRWIRTLLRALAAEGRTVFLSSHLMSEMALTADRLIVIGRGRLLAQASVEDFLGGGSGSFVRVRCTERDALARLLEAQGATVVAAGPDALRITGLSGDAVGELARVNQLGLQELATHQVSLEERYMELTGDAVDYRTAGGALAPAPN